MCLPCVVMNYEPKTTRTICVGIWPWYDCITLLSYKLYTYDHFNFTCNIIYCNDSLLIF